METNDQFPKLDTPIVPKEGYNTSPDISFNQKNNRIYSPCISFISSKVDLPSNPEEQLPKSKKKKRYRL